MKPFALNTSDEDFVRRQKSVFDQLSNLESNLNRNTLGDDAEAHMDLDEPSPSVRYSRKETKPYRGKNSIFKVPKEPPLTKNYIKRMPDFKRNPHKWIKYSLDDVKDEDMSDSSNTKAALSFLNELKERNDKKEENQEDVKGKIVFTPKAPKPSIVKGDGEDKPTFRSSKMVMPEYIVGQKLKKDKKNKALKDEAKGKELKLDHLLNEEEDDNE